ncbi:MAG: 23S ribosomal RNA methyltransferase Erm [Saprospiraceae bacterium]|nr:23S ribosomal RNA methyltransferase Erm [Saprospiraceae bacterium]
MPNKVKQPRRSIALSQNFINNRGIISTIVSHVDFSRTELLIEIGPGKGIITDAIIKPHNKVIAVEIDKELFSDLKDHYKGVENISIVHADFLKYPLPKEEYTIVANIPFNITADIIRKITDENSLLQTAYIITEKEAAYKFVGAPYAESPLLAHYLHIHYEVRFLMQIDRKHFTPEPRVDIGFISISKRRTPIFNKQDEIQFKDFITYLFSRTGGTFKESLKNVFSNLQAKNIIQQLGISENILKKKVTFFDWVKVYKTFSEHSPAKSKFIIRGAFEKLNQDKAKLQSQKKRQVW